MSIKRAKPVPRKQCADALPNRARILEIAKHAFTKSGANTGLDDVAKRSFAITAIRLQTKNVQYPIRCDRDAFMSVDREGDRIGNDGTACLEIP